MHDWAGTVRRRLGRLHVDRARHPEICAELAGHLEDTYAEALRRGYPEEDAVACAMAQVPDWTDLAQTIDRAEHEERYMSPQARTVLLPGLTTLIGAAVCLAAVNQWTPPDRWADPRMSPHVLAAVFALSVYAALGALGAAWSRRAGGTPAERLVAGVFPVAMHVAVVAPAIAVGMVNSSGVMPPNFQLGVVLALIVAPGAALALGALPFLRNGAGAGVYPEVRRTTAS